MKSHFLPVCLALLLTALSCGCSCGRSRNEVWDDAQTATRHMSRGFKALGGKHGDSRQVCRPDDFCPVESRDFSRGDFVPFYSDEDDELICMEAVPQAIDSPGDPGGPIPGIEAFRDPSKDPLLSSIFENVHFDYNLSLIKGGQNERIVRSIADYMKRRPNLYLFIEGHCDERGPDAYNLALGTRRSNAVRNMLVEYGVDPNRLFAVSYGKERPLVAGHDESSWSLNRRAQFKVFFR